MTGPRSRNAGRRVALVGAGTQGRKLSEALSALGYAVVAGCDLNAASLKKFSAQHPDAIVTAKISELAGVSLDFVVVGTLADGHLPVIRELDAIDVKKILCEKPIVGCIADLRDLQDLVQKRDLEIVVNHTSLWHPDYQTVKEHVQRASLGALRRVATKFKPAGFGNIGSHSLTHILFFLETHIASVQDAWFADSAAKKRASGHDDRNGKVTYLLENGIELELDNLPTVTPRAPRIDFDFDRGRIELFGAAGCFVVWDGVTGRVSEIPFQLQGYGLKKSPKAAHALLDRVASSLLDGDHLNSFSLACQAVEGVIAAQQCFVNTTPVSLPLERETKTPFPFS
jgi:predicted dehydrogenase